MNNQPRTTKPQVRDIAAVLRENVASDTYVLPVPCQRGALQEIERLRALIVEPTSEPTTSTATGPTRTPAGGGPSCPDFADGSLHVIPPHPHDVRRKQIEAEALAAIVAGFDPGAMPEAEAADCLHALREAGLSIVRTEYAVKAGLDWPDRDGDGDG